MKDIIRELQDYRHLSWTKTRKSSGTAGSFLKAYDDTGDRKKYYKLSDYDPMKGIVGHECVNEIIVGRLLDLWQIPHLEYKLIHSLVVIDEKEYETWLCESEDYKKKDETKLPLEDYYLINRQGGETPFEFCVRMGWTEYVYEMLLIDYLVQNRDRHGANIEVLRSQKEKSIRLAPLFDQGLSLVCRCHSIEELESFDVMEDRPVQAFIGTGSTLENVKLVPKEFISSLSPLKCNDLLEVLSGVEEIIGKPHTDKISTMIWERWNSLGDL